MKRIVLFRTKPGISQAQLREWWAEHSKTPRTMQGLRGYVTNIVLEELLGASNVRGVAEFWFDTAEAMHHAFDPANSDSRAAYPDADRVRIVAGTELVEEHVVMPPPHRGEGAQSFVKRITLFKRKPAITTEDFRTWYLGGHTALARKMAGLQGYVTHLVERELQGSLGLHGIAMFWFKTREEHDQAYKPGAPLRDALIKDAASNVDIVNTYLVEERVVLPPPFHRQGAS